MKSSSLSIFSAIALLAVTQTSQATSPDYIVATSSGASIVPGTDDIGLHDDDATQNIILPFSVMFYDQVFNSVNVSTNGNLQFITSSNSTTNCLATSTANNIIAPFWADLYTGDTADGQGIFTSVSGVSPNRIFNIEWRTQYCCLDGVPDVNFEVRLYEGQRRIDFIYGNILADGHQIGIGVQRDSGSQSTVVSCGTSVPTVGTQYTFTIPETCIPAPPNMIAWWPGDGNADDIQGGHPGTLLGGASFAAGEVQQAFSLNGTGAHIAVGDVDVPATFTIDAWINPTDLSSNPRIFSKDDDTTARSYELRATAAGYLEAVVYNAAATGSQTFYTTNTAPIVTGSFQHVAVTYDGSASAGEKLKFYVNGVNIPASPVIGNDAGGTPKNTSVAAVIGIAGNRQTGPFNGLIDEVEVFDRVLSSTEIEGIYSAGSAGHCHCTPPPPNMISWWPGEGDGADIQDGNALSAGNGNGFGFTTGEVGQAFSFDGSQFATAGTPANLIITGSEVTIDGWIKPNTADASGHYFGRAVSSGNDYAVLFTNGTLNGVIKTGNGEVFVTPGFTPPAGEWTHVALSYDGTTIRLYVNGTEIDSESQTGNISDSGAPFNLGGRGDGFDFNGQIDEVEVFDRTLGGDEIAAIYHAGSAGKCRSCTPAPSGMIDWWPGDGNANDIQGGHSGTLQNGATFATGEVAAAFSFDGTDDFVSLPASSDWNFGTGDFTFDFWARGNGTGRMQALSFDPDLGTRNLDFDFNDTFGLWVYWNSGGSNSIQVGAPGDYTDGKWHYFALTRSGTTLTLYIDGAAKGNTTFSDPIDLSGGSNNYFGAGINTGSPGYFWNGGIDEVEIFNRALSASEIATIYDAGSGGKCKPAISAARQLANISTRASVGTGDNVAIGGFIIHDDPVNPNRSHPNGTSVATKQVIIRGLGPSLQVNGVPVTGRLADPVLELHDGNGAILETNDNWGDAANASDIQASGFAPSDPNESAILVTLNSHSAYTAILSGAGSTTGIGLVEVFDLEKTSNTHLANISTRAFVSTGDDVLIGGLIVQGDTSARVIVRAIGPSLTAFGVSGALQDPVLELHDTNGALIASNDDWTSSPDAAAISASGFAPSNAKESAILLAPAPGLYTAIVSGNGPTPTGIGLVEAFRLQN